MLDNPPPGCGPGVIAAPGDWPGGPDVHPWTPLPSPSRGLPSTGSTVRSTAAPNGAEHARPRGQQRYDGDDGAKRIEEDTHTELTRPSWEAGTLRSAALAHELS